MYGNHFQRFKPFICAMEEIPLTDLETRYYSDLFICCDEEKTGKIPMLKATELFRSANISNEVINEITSLASIPATALHISRNQFYSCLKLIAAHQSGLPLRQETLVVGTVQLPLPRFSWKESPSLSESNSVQTNGGSITAIPPPPSTDRKNSLTRSRQDWQEVRPTSSRKNSSTQQQQIDAAAVNSDVPSTDSEVEQNESSSGVADSGGGHGNNSRGIHRRRAGSPEAWSTNSDSPTPTNSVAERPWAKENLWHGLLGDEHRQLLGTEEESSDRHSSDDDIQDAELETIYQITPEQREYYYNHFKAVQHDPNGLLSGQVARNFFEKSRVPVEELRHIWQLCDVTRDGALSLYEFTAAMHLVVLRHNNIPLPKTLPAHLHPNVLQNAAVTLPPIAPAPSKQVMPSQAHEPPEADLLHLNDDEEEENTENTIATSSGAVIGSSTNATNEKNVMNVSTLSTSSQASIKSRSIIGGVGGNHVTGLTPPPPPPAPTLKVINRSIPNSPHEEPSSSSPSSLTKTRIAIKNKERSLWTTDVPPTQWTKFTESPTSNVSSPGPKPVNFDMQRTAQAVVSDPQILHPVPLRVTPVAGAISNSNSNSATNVSDTPLNQEVYDGASNNSRSYSPKPIQVQTSGGVVAAAHHRDSLQQQSSDLRAIQRPQAKKLPSKNFGGIPPPPQREPSVGSTTSSISGVSSGAGGDADIASNINTNNINNINNNNQNVVVVVGTKKDIQPPLPPPRPHRHGRSSSLDLNKFKMNEPGQQAETDSNREEQHSLPPHQVHQPLPPSSASSSTTTTTTSAIPFSRISLQSNQRVSAFEVYRKPNTPRNSQSPPPLIGPCPPPVGISSLHSQMHFVAQQQQQHQQSQPIHLPPPPAPFGAAGAAAIAGAATLPPPPLLNADIYEKRVNAITDSLRHVSFKPDGSSMTDILRHLREQNSLLLHLCNDLSDELLSVQTRKEELRIKLDSNDINQQTSNSNNNTTAIKCGGGNNTSSIPVPRTGSSISAPVTANITGGSGSSGVHSNV